MKKSILGILFTAYVTVFTLNSSFKIAFASDNQQTYSDKKVYDIIPGSALQKMTQIPGFKQELFKKTFAKIKNPETKKSLIFSLIKAGNDNNQKAFHLISSETERVVIRKQRITDLLNLLEKTKNINNAKTILLSLEQKIKQLKDKRKLQKLNSLAYNTLNNEINQAELLLDKQKNLISFFDSVNKFGQGNLNRATGNLRYSLNYAEDKRLGDLALASVINYKSNLDDTSRSISALLPKIKYKGKVIFQDLNDLRLAILRHPEELNNIEKSALITIRESLIPKGTNIRLFRVDSGNRVYYGNQVSGFLAEPLRLKSLHISPDDSDEAILNYFVNLYRLDYDNSYFIKILNFNFNYSTLEQKVEFLNKELHIEKNKIPLSETEIDQFISKIKKLKVALVEVPKSELTIPLALEFKPLINNFGKDQQKVDIMFNDILFGNPYPWSGNGFLTSNTNGNVTIGLPEFTVSKKFKIIKSYGINELLKRLNSGKSLIE